MSILKRISGGFSRYALSPWVVIACLGAGVAFGLIQPALSRQLTFVGDIYLDLLKMTTLPFMVSAVIFSVQRLFRLGSAPRVFVRMVTFCFVALVIVAVAATIFSLLLKPGSDLPSSVLASLGQQSGATEHREDFSVINFYGANIQQEAPGLVNMLVKLVPENIFAALAAGDSLKALIFALLFGLAVGGVPERTAAGLGMVLETVYCACQKIIQALTLPLPVILFCMSAAQIATTGVGPLLAMLKFLLTFAAVSLALMALSVFIIWRRSGVDLRITISALREPFSMAMATRNSVAAMPSMIEGLVRRLGYSEGMVELLVPITISLVRLGPTVYYVCTTIFIAQLYAVTLTPTDVLIVIVASLLAGLASSGSTSILTVSLIGIACGYLGLPFEAVFPLLIAIDPVCDMLRTLLLVIGNSAVVAGICPRPLRI